MSTRTPRLQRPLPGAPARSPSKKLHFHLLVPIDRVTAIGTRTGRTQAEVKGYLEGMVERILMDCETALSKLYLQELADKTRAVQQNLELYEREQAARAVSAQVEVEP